MSEDEDTNSEREQDTSEHDAENTDVLTDIDEVGHTIVCLCPEPNCSSNKARTLVTYQGGQAFDICLCLQSFIVDGCCGSSASCYCS